MDNSIYNIILGTAGHIDHGKSTLVQRMTGINPMRLKEENERGMTIDMGFVSWSLEDGRKVGMIDVPGHERFVKNMVAGASSIDLVILVVAADDAIMPQTREHVQIMSLLGIQRGVVALTKIDLVDQEMLELVQEDIREFLAGTFLEKAPLFPLDSLSGRGFDTFIHGLNQLAKETPPRSIEGLFRMPIQRVFTKKGHGTVVTGIPLSGRISVGEEIEILPHGFKGKIRGIQAYGSDVEEARAGHSTALNISDIDHNTVVRGNMACVPSMFHSTPKIDAYFHYLPHLEHPLKHLSLVRLHLGTSEILADLRILKEGTRLLHPGEAGYIQLVLKEPLQVCATDRFILRLHSPMITIGGGEVLGETHRFIRGKSWELEEMDLQLESIYEHRKRIEYLIRQRGRTPLALNQLHKEANLTPEKLQEILQDLLNANSIFLVENKYYLHQDILKTAGEELLTKLKHSHKNNKLRLFMDKLALKNELQWESLFFEGVLSWLLFEQKVQVEKGGIKERNHQINLSKKEQESLKIIEETYRNKGFSTPRVSELDEFVQGETKTTEKLVKLLVEQGILIQLPDQILLHQEHFEKSKQHAIEQIQKHGELISADFGKNILQTSRKYFIPLLDYLDQKKITIRQGSNRILSPEFAKSLLPPTTP
jgi:selenocysteine-specific elongation factor